MRYKAKVLVGLYQCLSAVPSAFNVLPPQGLEEYSRWIDLIEVPSELENIFVPAACLGNYRTRIFLGSLWPVGLVGLVSIASVAWELLQHHRQADGHSARSLRTVCAIGLQRVLPLTLGLTFLVVPSTSMRIFRSFNCETFEYDQETSRRYLYADLTLSCDSDEYEATQSTAFAMLALWPVGIPVLYASLLWASRDALRTGVPTSLSRATAFLSGDYDAANFWWEPLEMCRKLTLTGWVLLIRGEAEQARVITALFVSIGFFGLNLRFRPLKDQDNESLTTLSHLALILVYTCVLVIKTCELSPDACRSYGFGASAKGFFLFFIFFGFSMLLFQLIIEAFAIAYQIRMQNKLRRLRHRGGRFVELPLLTKEAFQHLPGLVSSPYFHLFLSHAWPLGQDVCKLIKQRCREICPSLVVFLDVEDLTSGYGAESVDSSQCVLIFAMHVYFEKINCVRELVRAIVRNKPITLLLPDAEVHGEFTQAMVREIVTDVWVEQWKLGKLLAEWATEWGVAELKEPTAAEMCDALFKQPPLEWSRLTPFQDRTMVLMCKRLLPEAGCDIFLQGASSFKLPKGHTSVTIYCSRHNPGAAELAEELNAAFSSNIGVSGRGSRGSQGGTLSKRLSPGIRKALSSRGISSSRERTSGRFLHVVDELGSSGAGLKCDHMLVYLNAVTWMHDQEALAVEIREAQRLGVHLQLCHEFPSVLDPGSARKALNFKQIIDTTPPALTSGARNIYKQIAISLKGGELREVGLAALASKLVIRVPRAPVNDLVPSEATSLSIEHAV